VTVAAEKGPGVVDAGALGGSAELARIEEALNGGERAAVGGLWGSSQALVLAALAARSEHTWVAVTATDPEAEGFQGDLAAFGAEALVFPARAAGARRGDVDLDSVRERLQVAQRLAGPRDERPRIVVASMP